MTSDPVVTEGPAPVPASDRVALLDVLRGIAILGILVLNIEGFSGYVFAGTAQRAALPASAADPALGRLMVALIEGEFYSLFGPIEWIWRQATYGKRVRLRR